MRKAICLLLTVAVACSLCACGSPNEPNLSDSLSESVSSIEKAYKDASLQKSIIMFLEIPWGSCEDNAIALVKKSFPDINHVEEKTYSNTATFSDPSELIAQKTIAETVRSKCVKLTNLNEGTYSYTIPLESVAGYKVFSIYLYFVEIEHEFLLYEAAYCFYDSSDIDPLGQFSDLQSKMTNLYGEPETYTYDSADAIKATHACAIWTTDDNSAAFLQYSLYLSGSELINGTESVWLYYGTTSFNEYLKTTEEDYLLSLEEAQQKRIDEIKDDDSGL